jgi:glycosyltransferase involved in cell wall biosynthesis
LADDPVPAGTVRVLRVIARLNVGGPALQAAVLSRALDPDRFEQLVVAGALGPREGDYVALRAPDLQVSYLPGLGRAPHAVDDLRALAGLVQTIRRFRPHIVHTHTAKAGVLGRLAAHMCGVPATVHTFHGHLLNGYFSPLVGRGVVDVERIFARGTTRLVAVGDQVRRDLLAAGIGRPDQYTVVAPGVRLPPPPSKPVARHQLGLPTDRRVVAFVARLTAVKRPDRFAEMAAIVASRHPEALFVAVGDGELAEDLISRADRAGVPFRLLGWRSQMEAVYAASDVVVLTSDNEGMPLSLIEAQAAGVPCVTTGVGSTPEVIADGETGFVTGPDPSELARAVDRLLGDEGLRSTMGRAAARRAGARFGPERLASDVARIYEEVLRPAGPGALWLRPGDAPSRFGGGDR